VICVVFLTNVHGLVIKMNVANKHGGRIKTANYLFTRVIINAVHFTSPRFFLFLFLFFFKQPTLSFPSATYIGPFFALLV